MTVVVHGWINRTLLNVTLSNDLIQFNHVCSGTLLHARWLADLPFHWLQLAASSMLEARPEGLIPSDICSIMINALCICVGEEQQQLPIPCVVFRTSAL